MSTSQQGKGKGKGGREYKASNMPTPLRRYRRLSLPEQRMKARPARPDSIERGNKMPETDTEMDRSRLPPQPEKRGLQCTRQQPHNPC